MKAHHLQRLFMHQKNVWLGMVVVVVLVLTVWFGTSLPTTAARYVWNAWQAGELALMLDRADAALAYRIGGYYFGNQSAIGTSNNRPYLLPLAEKAYGKAIAIDSKIALAHYMRARIEFVHADFAGALADLNTELALYPENKRTLYMRGLTYAYRGESGDLALAEQDFRAFSAWAPTEWAGYNDLAFVLGKEGKYADAAGILKAGIKNAKYGTENPWLWAALGVMQLNLHKSADAISSFTKAQTLATSLTETDWQRAYPGNDPVAAHAGIDAIQVGIARNVIKAYAAQNK